MRVLHITGAMNRAGTETMLMNIYRNIDRERIQFDFVTYSKQEAHYDEEIRQLGGRIIRIERPQSIKEHTIVMKQYGPYDVVHAHTLFHCGNALIAAKISGVPVRIAHAHTTEDNESSLVRKIYLQTMREVINKFSTNLLACSSNAGSYLFGEKGVSGSKYAYFPNLIEHKKFMSYQEDDVVAFKSDAGLTNQLVIGHVGRFIEPKNHHFLLEILGSLKKKQENCKLLLVGDGDLRRQIEESAKEQGLSENVVFAGVREDVDTMFRCMDIFVFPSKYEGLGLVLLEAQASGLPCIVSEAIQPEADLKIGLMTRLYLRDSAENWAEIIIQKTRKNEVDQKKIRNAFIKEGYSMDTGIRKLLSIYN